MYAKEMAASNGHFGFFELLLEWLTTEESFLQYFENDIIELFKSWQPKLVLPEFGQAVFECAFLKALQVSCKKQMLIEDVESIERLLDGWDGWGRAAVGLTSMYA